MNFVEQHTVCEKDKCNGCMVCKDICPTKAITVVDNCISFNAIIDDSLCIACGRCEKVCPNDNISRFCKPIEWHQGWASEPSVRDNSSSGGIAAAISRAFIKTGGAVCSCLFTTGEFRFEITHSVEAIKKFSGSKYVKSNPTGIYKQIKHEINTGKKVLFIGLPCQIAAVKNYIGDTKLLYTVDLICHGTPSPKLLEKYLDECKHNIKSVKDLKFRQKTNFRLTDDYVSIKPPTVQDRYTYAFLRGLCYTENCYYCKYAKVERISDITLGDSWGSQLPKDERDKGVSLILCQTKAGQELLNIAELHLQDVDVTNAIANNKQLKSPSTKPEEYNTFFSVLQKTNNFSRAVKKSFPRFCLRQDAKALMVKIGIRGGGR